MNIKIKVGVRRSVLCVDIKKFVKKNEIIFFTKYKTVDLTFCNNLVILLVLIYF